MKIKKVASDATTTSFDVSAASGELLLLWLLASGLNINFYKIKTYSERYTILPISAQQTFRNDKFCDRQETLQRGEEKLFRASQSSFLLIA